MTRKSVRAALNTSLKKLEGNGVETVFDAMPKIIQGAQMPAVVIEVGNSSEKRDGSQKKLISYDATLKVGAVYPTRLGEKAEKSFDDVLDAIIAHLRADKTLGVDANGDPNVARSGEEIEVETSDAQADKQNVRLFALVKTTVEEWITSA